MYHILTLQPCFASILWHRISVHVANTTITTTTTTINNNISNCTRNNNNCIEHCIYTHCAVQDTIQCFCAFEILKSILVRIFFLSCCIFLFLLHRHSHHRQHDIHTRCWWLQFCCENAMAFCGDAHTCIRLLCRLSIVSRLLCHHWNDSHHSDDNNNNHRHSTPWAAATTVAAITVTLAADAIDKLPLMNGCYVYGLHANAEINVNRKTIRCIWDRLIGLQPQSGLYVLICIWHLPCARGTYISTLVSLYHVLISLWDWYACFHIFWIIIIVTVIIVIDIDIDIIVLSSSFFNQRVDCLFRMHMLWYFHHNAFLVLWYHNWMISYYSNLHEKKRNSTNISAIIHINGWMNNWWLPAAEMSLIEWKQLPILFRRKIERCSTDVTLNIYFHIQNVLHLNLFIKNS